MKKTIIISAFPGTGKTYFTSNTKEYLCKDSDSSSFSWITYNSGEKERNPDFPNNYINDIKDNIGKFDIIFVSSHKEVRDSLENNNIPFIVIVPFSHNKEQYLERYKNRGNDEKFIEFMDNNFENFINAILTIESNKIKPYILLENEYLSDVIPKILIDNNLKL